MKVIIDILKIHCSRTTIDEFNPDEIYSALFLSALKINANEVVSTLEGSKPLWGVVTDVETLVKRGDTRLPTPNHFEIDIADDTKVLGFKLALYEKDKGAIFEKMKNELTGIIKPEGFDFDSITLPDGFDIISIIKALFGILKKAIIHFGQDDLLGEAEVVSPIENLVNDAFPREFEFKKHGSKYEMSVAIKITI